MRPEDVFAERRRAMVESQIESRGVTDARVLAAMREVPREGFVAAGGEDAAYHDSPLPLGWGQTVSQPFIVALMAAALDLRPTDRVLEVGAGAGYAAAVMSRIAREVWAVERIPALAEAAARNCARAGYANVHVVVGDGSVGLPEHAPYDAISVACAAPRVPEALVRQLAPGGRLVIPVGDDFWGQELLLVRRTPDGDVRTESLGGVRFVPLVGAQGFRGDDA